MKITNITIRREACISVAQFETARIAVEMSVTVGTEENPSKVYAELDSVVSTKLGEAVDDIELDSRRAKSKARRFGA